MPYACTHLYAILIDIPYRAYLFELPYFIVPEHDEPVLSGRDVTFNPGPGAGVHGTGVAGSTPVNAVGLRIVHCALCIVHYCALYIVHRALHIVRA